MPPPQNWRGYFAGLWCYAPRHPVETHVAAAGIYQACRRAGKTPRSSDCLIARIAIEHGLAILHSDRDFEAIASVIPGLKLLR